MVNLNIDLPEGFLEEEERCGFLVTRERKALWAVELDLLNEFIRVCEENGLRYMMVAGSLLGAVRHKGFIPWDDDIDIMMLREDYDKLISLKDCFQSPYFLQCLATDRNYTLGHAKLRNSSTTGCTRKEQDRDMNRGMFLDIFPLDGISQNEEDDKKQAAINKKYRNLLWIYRCTHVCMVMGNSPKRRLQSFFKRFLSLFFRDGYMGFFIRKDIISRKFEENLKKHSVAGTELWGSRTLNFFCPRVRFLRKDLENTIQVPFEFLQVTIPEQYHSILSKMYRNYMEFPKNKIGGNMHGDLTVDLDTPYEDYFRRKNRPQL